MGPLGQGKPQIKAQRSGVLRRWNDVSIARRLFLVVGVMATLIVGELAVLRFAMRTLSAVRAFVQGESLWSKAQKNAALNLQRYARTGDEADYRAFLAELDVPQGDHAARMELLKPAPDMAVVRQGFLQGHIDADDIEPMVDLLRRFHQVSHIARAIDAWTKGDELLERFRAAGVALHDARQSNDATRAGELLPQISALNRQLTAVEEEFSFALGQGSHWVERVVLALLSLLVFLVEGVGLTLSFVTIRSLSRGLKELSAGAARLGGGDFSYTLPVRSADEIGTLAADLNEMGRMLKDSYAELERRVAARTEELAKAAAENAKLYQQAQAAVGLRDEFLSVASHELRTPLTALQLKLHLLNHKASLLPKGDDTALRSRLTVESLQQSTRLARLLDHLLDLTRLQFGQLELNRTQSDLVPMVREIVGQFGPQASAAGSEIALREESARIVGSFDAVRIGQVVTNLISNALKYGDGTPIEVSVAEQGGVARVKVRDLGPGIPKELQGRIFERYERASGDHAAGLGLGLHISREIVAAHGGTIAVDSAPAEGATFTVSLPLA